MPLKKHVTRQREKIGAFLNDPATKVLRIKTSGELLPVAGKLVASFHRDDDLRGVFFAHPGEGDDVEAYFAAWVASARAAFEDYRERFAELDLVAPGLGEVELPEPDRSAGVEARHAAWFEAVARLLAPLARRVVLVAFLDDSLEPETCAALAAFGALLGSARVKLILVDARTGAPSDHQKRAARYRVESLVAADRDPRPAVRDFLQSESSRVLVVRDGAPSLEGLLASTEIRHVHFAWAVPYKGRARFEPELLRHAIEELDRRSGSLPKTLAECTLAERLTSACSAVCELAASHRLVVVIDPRPVLQPEKIAPWVRDLVLDALDPRVKFIVLDDPTKPVAPHVTGLDAGVVEMTFTMGANDIEAGSQETAEDPEASPAARLQAHLALAGFASGRKELDVALEHVERAGKLAGDSKVAVDLATVAMTKGNILYRKGDFRSAKAAYSVGIEHVARHEGGAPVAGLLPQLVVGLGNAHLRLDELADAQEAYELAAKIERTSGAFIPAIYADVWRGEAARRAGNAELARQVWQACLGLADEIGPDLEVARASLRAELLERLARLADDTGDARQSHELHEHAAACGCEVFVAVDP